VEKSPARQQYSLLVRTVKDARFEETVGQHYGGFPEKVVYSYIGDRLSHEAVTEKLRDTLSASGFQISQGWGASREPDLELQSELLKYAVYTRGGLGSQNTVANVSIKVLLRDLRSQKVIFEDIVSKSQTVTSKSPELLNTVVDQTVVAIANQPALTRGLPPPGSSPPPFPTIIVQNPPGSFTPSLSRPPTQKPKPGTGGRQQASTPESPAKPVGKEQKWAVVVGIGKYQDSNVSELKYTRNDAQGIYDYLIDPRGGGFPKDNVRLLIDDQATRVNILSALGTFLARNALKNDKVFIFYAGHGAPEADYTRKESDGFSKYLVPYDANANDLYATGIPMAEIRTIFERVESDQLIFVADACYSGASGGRTFSAVKGARAIRITGDFVENLAPKGSGRVILAASDVNEVSLELPELKHGIFTYYLLEGLRGAADVNKDGKISVQEAYDYLSEKVSRHSKQAGGNQHPIWKGEIKGTIFF